MKAQGRIWEEREEKTGQKKAGEMRRERKGAGKVTGWKRKEESRAKEQKRDVRGKVKHKEMR